MNNYPDKIQLIDEDGVNAALEKVAKLIISEFPTNELSEIALIGIQMRGVPFVKHLVDVIEKQTGQRPLLGTLDISMYRDDVGLRKSLVTIKETDIPFDVNGRKIILADDVLYTGRTIRAALDALTDYGRPELIRLASLVDRGHREFPITADYTGITLDVPPTDRIKVAWSELDGMTAVFDVNIKDS